MQYRLEIPRRVRVEIDRLPGYVRQRVRRAIAGLVTNPRPPGAKALREELDGYYRIRVDAYRVIYTIDDTVVVVQVVRVAQRTGGTYTGLSD